MRKLFILMLSAALLTSCATAHVVCDRNGVDTIDAVVVGEASASCAKPGTAAANAQTTAEVKGGKLSGAGWVAVGILARGAACRISFGLLC